MHKASNFKVDLITTVKHTNLMAHMHQMWAMLLITPSHGFEKIINLSYSFNVLAFYKTMQINN